MIIGKAAVANGVAALEGGGGEAVVLLGGGGEAVVVPGGGGVEVVVLAVTVMANFWPWSQ